MKVLVTGASGQLGQELKRTLSHFPKIEVLYASRSELDITDRKSLEAYIRHNEPTHVINCAAYTAVDAAEDEKSKCLDTNVHAVETLASMAEDYGFHILHISTDYIFDGSQSKAYSETDKPSPLSVYGSSKRKSETALLALAPSSMIIRTGWLYSSFGRNFVKSILDKASRGLPLKVVNDQIGTPTFAGDLAAFITFILQKDIWTPGIFNYSNEGVASWYDLAVAACEAAGLTVQVTPIPSSDYPTAAQRPRFSVLDKAKVKATFGIQIPHWQTSLRKCVAEIISKE